MLVVQNQFKVQQPQELRRRVLKCSKVEKDIKLCTEDGGRGVSNKHFLSSKEIWISPVKRDLQQREKKSNFWGSWIGLVVHILSSSKNGAAAVARVNIEVNVRRSKIVIFIFLAWIWWYQTRFQQKARLRLKCGWSYFVSELLIVYFRSHDTRRIHLCHQIYLVINLRMR